MYTGTSISKRTSPLYHNTIRCEKVKNLQDGYPSNSIEMFQCQCTNLFSVTCLLATGTSKEKHPATTIAIFQKTTTKQNCDTQNALSDQGYCVGKQEHETPPRMEKDPEQTNCVILEDTPFHTVKAGVKYLQVTHLWTRAR